MKTAWLALGTSVFGIALFAGACGGAESTDVLGASPAVTSKDAASGGTSGGGTSGGGTSGGGTSGGGTSGGVCDPCFDPDSGQPVTDGGRDAGTKPEAGPTNDCQWAKDDPCPAGMYCAAPTCGKGTCVPKGTTEAQLRDPQCGCDGVTYWNTSVAEAFGQSIRKNGVCQGGNVAQCAGFTGAACPAGGSCNLQVKKDACGGADVSGVCWHPPTSCGEVTIGGRARPCGSASPTCKTECTAIKAEQLWSDDSSCL